MNEARLRELATFMRGEDVAKHFSLDTYFADFVVRPVDVAKPLSERILSCGAVACGAGWAVILFAPDETDSAHLHDRAADLLELSPGTADDLFTPDSDYVCYGAVTPDMFADVLVRLADTGKVEWPALASAWDDEEEDEEV